MRQRNVLIYSHLKVPYFTRQASFVTGRCFAEGSNVTQLGDRQCVRRHSGGNCRTLLVRYNDAVINKDHVRQLLKYETNLAVVTLASPFKVTVQI